MAASVPLLVPKDIHSTSLEALKLITSRELIFVEKDQVISLEECFVPGPVIFHSDSTIANWSDELKINSTIIQLFRSKILSSIPESLNDKNWPEKVFLLRGKQFRGLINQEAIAQIASKYGYEVIDPIDLSFLEQVKLFSSAKKIITSGGAVMSNFLFCNPNTRIANIYSEQISNYPIPAVLASFSGGEYSSLESVSKKTKFEVYKRDKHHRDSFLNQAKFKKFLKHF